MKKSKQNIEKNSPYACVMTVQLAAAVILCLILLFSSHFGGKFSEELKNEYDVLMEEACT